MVPAFLGSHDYPNVGMCVGGGSVSLNPDLALAFIFSFCVHDGKWAVNESC